MAVLDRPDGTDSNHAIKMAHRAMWGLGDYHAFATATVWELGPVLVGACRITRGQRVLDVAAGSGNVAIRAAQAGATVAAADLSPANVDAGRRASAAAGVEIEWVEADAEALPWDAGRFDVVTSCFGVMFAPDQRKAASELLRVCRPGGTIGLINFTAEGRGGEFFALLGAYAPPPPGQASPLAWGSEAQVTDLFGAHVDSLQMTRHEYVETAPSAAAYRDLFKRTFGPAVAIYSGLADRPARAAALDRELLDFAARANRAAPEAPVRIPYEYLLTIARKRR
jgi:ubiquinone/menaquinone biosynthesis C-methylase UbiE